MSTNPLRQPPFFPVANVNPDDPISVQIEQIEQLNTLLLQDIDHNFARFHDVVNNKILPQVKRYGIVSEPTRAASDFWKTFFYSAAFGQTALEPRHPDDADTSHAHGGPGYRHEEYEQTLTLDHTGMGDRTGEEDRGNEEDLSGLMTPDEHSFLYGNPIASTPLPRHHLQHLEGHPEQSSHGQGQGNAHGRSAHAHMNQPWAEGMSSMESPTPYASLERKMKEVLEDDDGMSSTAGSFLPEEIGLDTPKPGGSASGSRSGGYEPYQTPEGLDEEPSVLISRSDQSSSYHPPGEPSSAHKASASRDLPDLPRFKPKMPSHFQSPKAHMNPFSPVKPGNKSGTAAWDGIADLRNTPLNPKIRPLSFKHDSNGNGNGANRNQVKNDRTPRRAPTTQQGGGDDSFASDSDEEPQFGLASGGTPPVTMNFGLPDRTIVSKTPAKEAAKAVIRNLMMDDEGMDSPGMPTPPAFSRFGGGGGAGSTSMSMSSSAGKGSSMSPSRSAGGRGKGSLFSHELDQRGDETIRDTMGRMELDDSPLMGMTEPLPPSDLDQGQDPDVSTVGMPKHRRSTVPQLDFLDESFDDSLDEMPPPALPQGYVTESYGDAHQGQHRQHGRDVGQDSLAGEMEEEEGAVGEFTITEQQQSRGGGQDGTTRSEAGEVFGGPGRTGLGVGGFALFGPDEMQTFHGGQLLDAAASPQDSPSYALGARMAHKRG